jgi:hypothetical protein
MAGVVLVGAFSGALKVPVIEAVAVRSLVMPSKWLLWNVVEFDVTVMAYVEGSIVKMS